ncbi:hypothetical protein C8J57DRAFT_1727182 [Mycena rebaudengoi]|nr:hypothetical protein C8J57DRAFT_1727182 [Mycena rebaudengoi]
MPHRTANTSLPATEARSAAPALRLPPPYLTSHRTRNHSRLYRTPPAREYEPAALQLAASTPVHAMFHQHHTPTRLRREHLRQHRTTPVREHANRSALCSSMPLHIPTIPVRAALRPAHHTKTRPRRTSSAVPSLPRALQHLPPPYHPRQRTIRRRGPQGRASQEEVDVGVCWVEMWRWNATRGDDGAGVDMDRAADCSTACGLSCGARTAPGTH